MKLLFDQNLSYRLPRRLADIFPGSDHVRPLALDTAPDERIREFAKANGFCLVTQDSDFAERSRLYGAPPKVVWLRCGNSTPQEVEGYSAAKCDSDYRADPESGVELCGDYLTLKEMA